MPAVPAWAKLCAVARRRTLLGALGRGLVRAGVALIGLFAGLVVLYAFVDPVSTLMLARTARGEPYERIPAPLDAVAPAALAAVTVSYTHLTLPTN